MVLKCRIIGECVEWVMRQTQNTGWILMALKHRMVGERVDRATRYRQYMS